LGGYLGQVYSFWIEIDKPFGGLTSDFAEQFRELNLQKDLSAPEEPVWEEAKGGEGEGEGQGRDMGGVVASEDVAVGPEPGRDAGVWHGGVYQSACGDLDPEREFDEEVGEDEGGDGVGAEDQPGPEEGLSCGLVVHVADVDEPIAEGKQEERPAGAEEDVGTGPEVLVDGEGEGPEESEGKGDDAGEADYSEGLDLRDLSGGTGRMRGLFHSPFDSLRSLRVRSG
jgi:hypothetical protein